MATMPNDADPLAALSRWERVLCGKMVTRQARVASRAPRELSRYGPTGVAHLRSGRAFGVYVVILGVVGVVLAVIGGDVGPAGWSLIGLMWVAVGVAVWRLGLLGKRGALGGVNIPYPPPNAGLLT